MAFNKFASVVLGVCLWATGASAQAITGTPKHMVFASDTQYP